MSGDVPSPIDFHDPAQAKVWEEETIRKRPYRWQFFAAFAHALNRRHPRPFLVLELGSGPGHLAERVLSECAVARYAALDFSPAMHAIAKARLASFPERVEFIVRDFREPDWAHGLGSFDAVLTLQAAHETRHTRHLPLFLTRAKSCLKRGGVLLYGDHYAEEGSAKNSALFVSADEQKRALDAAGFTRVETLLDLGGMALYAAEI